LPKINFAKEVTSPSDLLKNAEDAMYEAKTAGKNTYLSRIDFPSYCLFSYLGTLQNPTLINRKYASKKIEVLNFGNLNTVGATALPEGLLSGNLISIWSFCCGLFPGVQADQFYRKRTTAMRPKPASQLPPMYFCSGSKPECREVPLTGNRNLT
jgi:hypothetical protein